MTPLVLRRWSLRLVMAAVLAGAVSLVLWSVLSGLRSMAMAAEAGQDAREFAAISAELDGQLAEAETRLSRATIMAADGDEARAILQQKIAGAFANRGGRLVTLRLEPEGEDRVTSLIVWQGDEAGARSALEALAAENSGAVVTRLLWRRIDNVPDVSVELELRLTQAWRAS